MCYQGLAQRILQFRSSVILSSFLSKYVNSILPVIYLSDFQQFPSGKAHLCIIIRKIILTYLVQGTLLSNWEIHIPSHHQRAPSNLRQLCCGVSSRTGLWEPLDTPVPLPAAFSTTQSSGDHCVLDDGGRYDYFLNSCKVSHLEK